MLLVNHIIYIVLTLNNNEVPNSITKCITFIKCNAKCESFFKKFQKDKNTDYLTLLYLRKVDEKQ